MKQKLSLLLALAALTNAAVAANPLSQNDTIVDVRHARRVVMTDNDSILTFSVQGSAADSSYSFNYTKVYRDDQSSLIYERASKWDFSIGTGSDAIVIGKRSKKKEGGKYISMGGIGFGMVTALGAPAEMEVDMSASYEIFVDFLGMGYRTADGKNVFYAGIGGNWRNWRMTGRKQFVKQGTDILVADYPEGAAIDFSRIKVYSFTVSASYGRRFGRAIDASLTAMLHFNTYASIKTKYQLDGRSCEEFNKHIHQTPVSVSLQGGLKWKGVGLYVKYNPFNVLNSAFAPNFQSLSTGLTFAY